MAEETPAPTTWDSMKEFLAAFRSRFKAKAKDGGVTEEEYAEIERWAISHTGGVASAKKKSVAANEDIPAYYTDDADDKKRLFMEAAFAETPEWIPCLPSPCSFTHPHYGKVDFSAERIENFVSQFKAGVYQSRIPVDAEHETKLSGAVGWISDMRVNEDGSADARVEWNDRGKGMLADDRYKYVSPEFYDSWTDPLTEETHKDVVIGLALTTRPFIKESALRRIAASESSNAPQEGQDMSEETKPEATPPPEGDAAKKPDEPRIETKIPEPKAPEPQEEPAKLSEEWARRFAESENERKALSEKVVRMETEARTRRFTEEVRGKSDANHRAWFGEPDKHVEFLLKLAEKFGEDSEEMTHYVTTQRANAEQLSKSDLFREIGSNDRPASTALAEVNKRVDALIAAKPTLTREKAMTEVVSSDPHLYAQYRAEEAR